MEINYKQVITGFEFNMAWYIDLANTLVYLNDAETVMNTPLSEHRDKMKPIQMLFSDLSQLVKAQTDLLKDTQSESHTSVPEP